MYRFIKYHGMKTFEVEVELHAFLNSIQDRGEWSALLSGRFTLGVRAPGIHWIEDCMGSRVGLDVMEERKIPVTVLPGTELRSSSP
jgi:hypothetical protein